jgi:hypothetical protein
MKHAMLTMAMALGAYNLKADIIYTLTSESINLGVTGTITTNGDTGTLGPSDILDWSITLPDGYVIDPSDGHLALGGDDLTATPHGLNFNFADTTTNSALLIYSTSPIE